MQRFATGDVRYPVQHPLRIHRDFRLRTLACAIPEELGCGHVSAPKVADEVERYLRTGDADPYLAAWPGGVIERGHRAHADLRSALIQEVQRLAQGLLHAPVPDGVGVDFTRSKVEPMVRGLFPRAEQDTVLAILEKSVVYVTSATVESILTEHDYDRSAWDLVNLYLGSLGAELSVPTPFASSV